jgi:hypothetical protein
VKEDQGVRLETGRDCGVEVIYDYYNDEDASFGPAELRDAAQAIVEWANWKMGEIPRDENGKVVLDPWGAPVDTRGM